MHSNKSAHSNVPGNQSTHSNFHSNPAAAANYLDIRTASNMAAVSMDTRYQHPLEATHAKQGSHDSAGSRSSGHGSLDLGQGHGSGENFAARTDTMSSEGFISGDERRHAAKDNTPHKGRNNQSKNNISKGTTISDLGMGPEEIEKKKLKALLQEKMNFQKAVGRKK